MIRELLLTTVLTASPASCNLAGTNEPPPVVGLVTVTRVIDGDTIEIETGRKIRVLGIDSCEIGTLGGGRARAEGRLLLLPQQVTLKMEPGITTDPYDRDLRYVILEGGRDYSEVMVVSDHTSVYPGGHAPKEYEDKLRAIDGDPAKNCD